MFAVCFTSLSFAQNIFTPEMLWQLGRLSPLGLSKDKKYIVYSVGIPNVEEKIKIVSKKIFYSRFRRQCCASK